MIYLINRILKYNAYDGTLYLLDGSIDMLTLSRVANELLLLMVENNESRLEREHILNELWTRRGLASSGNNLNNYISVLRKALASLGCSDLIITIPRYGFMFSAEIDVIPDNVPKSRATNPFQVLYSRENPCHNKLKKIMSSTATLFVTYKVSLLKILVLLCVVYSFSLPWSNDTHGEYHSFGLNKCTIYLLDARETNNKSEGVSSVIKKYVNEYHINCGRKADVFYWPGKHHLTNESTMDREIFAWCDDSHGASCINYGLFKHEN